MAKADPLSSRQRFWVGGSCFALQHGLIRLVPPPPTEILRTCRRFYWPNDNGEPWGCVKPSIHGFLYAFCAQ